MKYVYTLWYGLANAHKEGRRRDNWADMTSSLAELAQRTPFITLTYTYAHTHIGKCVCSRRNYNAQTLAAVKPMKKLNNALI